MSKQYQDLDTGEFHWTDEYVKELEAKLDSYTVAGVHDCPVCGVNYAYWQNRAKQLQAKLDAVAELPRFSPRDSNRGGVKMLRCDDGVFIQHFSVQAILKEKS